MSFDAGRVTATLDLDRSPFTRSLAEARRSAASFARQTYEASLAVRGSAETITELKGVDNAADRLDGRDVNLDVDKSGRASRSLFRLNGGVKQLASNIRATRTLLVAGAFIALPAAIGAAVPAVFALSASLGGLALNLGKAAAGFGLVAAAAGGGALVGLKAYGSLISKTLSDSRTLWEEANPGIVNAIEKQRTEIFETANGYRAWNAQLNDSFLGFTRLEAAIGSRVFPKFTRELDAWTGKLRQMRPYIANTAGDIAQIAVNFSEWFRTADDGSAFGEILGFISISAEKGARALSLIAQIGISAFRPLIPLAYGLQQSLIGVLGTTNKWVQSAEGQKRLGQVYRGLWNDAKKLWPVVRDLSIAVGNFFNLLDRTGIADQASRGLRTFAHWLREATERGGGLEDFLRDAKALMPFVGNAAGAVAHAIGRIATVAITARQAGHKLTILQEIFNGIAKAATPLQHLITGTFRRLGPAVAELLPAISRFFDAFTEGAAGPLVTFVDTLTRAVKFFNRLPGPVKRTVAQLAALKFVLGSMGVGAVVAPMGRFASNMFIASRAAGKLGAKSGLASVVGSLGKMGALLVGGLGLGLLAFGLVRAYNKNEQFRKSVDRLKDKVRPAFAAIQQVIDKRVLPALGRLADKGANAIIDIFDLGGKQKNQLEHYGRNASAQFGLGVRQQAKKIGDGDWVAELGRKIGQQIGKGLNQWAKGGGEGGGGDWLSRILGANSNPVNFGARLGDNVKKGMNKTHWNAVWDRIVKSAKNFSDWRPLGQWINEQFKKGFTPGDLGEWLANRLDKAFRKSFTPVDLGAWIKKKLIEGLTGGWERSGKNAAAGFIKGFKTGGITGGVVGALEEAWKAFKKKQGEKSPATKLWPTSGKNAALGYIKGFEDNISGLNRALDRALKAGKPLVAHRIGEQLESLNAFRLRPLANINGKPVSQWDMGDPRDSVNTVLNSRASSIDKNWARYLAFNLNKMSDAFRSRHADDIRRLAPRLRQLGFSDFEDGTLVSNQRMQQLQSGRRSGGRPAIDEDGMRRVMREHRSESARGHGGDAIDYNRLAHAIVGAMQSGLPGFIDNSMGGYFNHRNNMGADPR